jgi:hypothetical protein
MLSAADLVCGRPCLFQRGKSYQLAQDLFRCCSRTERVLKAQQPHLDAPQ